MGERFFSSGVDFEWAPGQISGEMRPMFLELGNSILAILECPVPVVGALKGHAIGGGLAIFSVREYRYAASCRVLLGKPENLLGVPNLYYGG